MMRTPDESQITDVWERFLNISDIGLDDDFFEIGGDSLVAAQIFAELEKRLARPLPLSLILEAPTVGTLAQKLADVASPSQQSCVVSLADGSSESPLFLLHPVGANLLHYRDLVRRLPPNQSVYGLQPVGLDGAEDPIDDLRAMATRYLTEIRRAGFGPPYVLAGSSMGGTVAFEMGCRLRAEGESNVSVWLFDTWGPGYIRYSDSALVCQFHKQVNRVRSHCINFFGRSGVDKLTYIKQVSRNVIDKFCCAIGVTDPTPISASIRSVWRANNHAITHFQLGSYDGEVVLFRASWQPSDANNDETLGWRPLVHGELVIREVSGYHGECCLEPHVASLAEAVNAELRRLSSEPVGA